MTTDRFRETAVRHARILEDQKRVKAQVTDLILECFDLPSKPDVGPVNPIPADAKIFGKALSLFQPTDFDELVSERNIDDRCGYALCPKPNQKARNGGNKVWNGKGGKDFRLIDRAVVERWCSDSCKARGEFVKGQLSTEPAWLRDVTDTKVTLLDDVKNTADLSMAIRDMSIDATAKDDITAKLKELSLERGDGGVEAKTGDFAIVEKESTRASEPPQPGGQDTIEGHDPRKVRFGNA
ncbi:uncharacterized protein HMPREF1541_01323 [Cyphellophora europaea CBS 101466]|uniref:RNA polymerase II subunit B1 CTD phosphatase RPAP2 homolog n=1 Tax=Cyphellophora europaea (strain CBS 101466) TaxID=1220924 RepID=W2SGK3_CYPE1|nr:uncharacterized protein HMPREF1541_01323 [Cyphellophora europaea CBS 101466]ETN47133.1 hypothetical protein HMPREF1541_01323 [Cyphellophora europaea CBS 101466]